MQKDDLKHETGSQLNEMYSDLFDVSPHGEKTNLGEYYRMKATVNAYDLFLNAQFAPLIFEDHKIHLNQF